MKKTLRGKRFANVEEVETASQGALNIKLQQFQRRFTQWEERLDKCIGQVYWASVLDKCIGQMYWTSVLPPVESILKGIKFFLFEI